MKFRFCGDGDCPDWVLAEIISSLSPMPHKDLQTLVELVADKIISDNFPEDKIKAIVGKNTTHIEKTAIACVHFLLISAARYNAAVNIFNEELLQLGLPKYHAAVVCSVLEKHIKSIRERLCAQSFKINELVEVQSSSGNAKNCAKLVLDTSHTVSKQLQQSKQDIVHIDKANISILLKDMNVVKQLMSKYSQDV